MIYQPYVSLCGAQGQSGKTTWSLCSHRLCARIHQSLCQLLLYALHSHYRSLCSLRLCALCSQFQYLCSVRLCALHSHPLASLTLKYNLNLPYVILTFLRNVLAKFAMVQNCGRWRDIITQTHGQIDTQTDNALTIQTSLMRLFMQLYASPAAKSVALLTYASRSHSQSLRSLECNHDFCLYLSAALLPHPSMLCTCILSHFYPSGFVYVIVSLLSLHALVKRLE